VGSVRSLAIAMFVIVLLAAACGTESSTVATTQGVDAAVTTQGVETSVEPPVVVVASIDERLLETADLESVGALYGSCKSIEGVEIDFAPFGEVLRESAPEMSWSVVVGPFDVEDASDRDLSLLMRTNEVELNALNGDLYDVGVRGLVSDAAVSSEPASYNIPNIMARYWPDDGAILLGTMNGRAGFGFSLFENGMAAIGYCMAGLSFDWNANVGALGLDSPLDAFDILLADASDPRLDSVLGLGPVEVPVPVDWVDTPPDERVYGSAPDEVLDRLQVASIVVYAPDDWNQQLGVVCSRTPEAMRDCAGFSVLQLLSNGEVGWIQKVFVVPGQPVTLFLLEVEGAPADLVEIPSELLTAAIEGDMAISVNLRPANPETPADFAADSSLTELIEIALIPLPEQIPTPPTDDTGP